ncbi:MAG: TolC family protein [Parvularculaceae bacterium]
MIRKLIIAPVLLLILTAPAPASALPPEETVLDAINASPRVAAAQAEVERASAAAKRLRVGEYEVVLSGGGGRRNVDYPGTSAADYTEWNAGLSRTVRLPGKRRADKDLASLEIELADAGLARTRMEALLEFASLWTEWRRAAEGAQTAQRLAEEARNLAGSETAAVKLGASRKIFVDQLRAEADLLLLNATRAEIDAQNARGAIAAAFPALQLPATPAPLDWNKLRIASLMAAPPPENPSLREARLALDQQEAKARRARLDRLPDPTLGVHVTNEFGGAETSVLATLSVPLGARARSASAAEAGSMASASAAKMKAAEYEAARREEQALRDVRSASLNLANAESAVQLARDALNRLQKGYAMGAVNLGDLTSTRRTLTETEKALVDYRVGAERAYLILAILHGQFGMGERDGV